MELVCRYLFTIKVPVKDMMAYSKEYAGQQDARHGDWCQPMHMASPISREHIDKRREFPTSSQSEIHWKDRYVEQSPTKVVNLK